MAKRVTVEEPLREKPGPKASESLIHLINKIRKSKRRKCWKLLRKNLSID